MGGAGGERRGHGGGLGREGHREGGREEGGGRGSEAVAVPAGDGGGSNVKRPLYERILAAAAEAGGGGWASPSYHVRRLPGPVRPTRVGAVVDGVALMPRRAALWHVLTTTKSIGSFMAVGGRTLLFFIFRGVR